MNFCFLFFPYICRNVVSFLFHSYPESSGRGKSSCQFTLGGAYAAMGGVKNANLSYEFFDEDAVGGDYFAGMLGRVQERARSELVVGVELCTHPPPPQKKGFFKCLPKRTDLCVRSII